MKDCIAYLKEIFGRQIKVKDLNVNAFLPMYIIQKYDLAEIEIYGEPYSYILVKPTERFEINIESIQKQMHQIERYTSCKPVLVLETLRRNQRNALIRARIPFVLPQYHIYLPSVMMNLLEKDVIQKELPDKFSVPAQVVFIYLLLKGRNIEKINARRLCKYIPYSSATLNRALSELVARKLLFTEGNNTRKIYKLIERKEYWKKGKNFLFDPVDKTYYAKFGVDHFGMQMSNELALTRLSWSLNESQIWYYATTADKIKEMKEELFISKYDIFDTQYVVIEQFRYDPRILSDTNYIDSISLYAQFKDTVDERLQIALDEILEGEV